MNLVSLLLLAVGLSMNAFAVAICKGLAMPRITPKKMAIVGLWFGGFQGLMPLLGYALSIQFEKYINAIAPWCAFVLLSLIGANMIREALSKGEDHAESATLRARDMLVLALATSIDALAVGITFACVPVTIVASWGALVNTLAACAIIAVTTCALSMIGVKIGNVFGVRYKSKAELAGGVILILLGIQIIWEHLSAM